jgi:hypothetical protein
MLDPALTLAYPDRVDIEARSQSSTWPGDGVVNFDVTIEIPRGQRSM